MSTCAQCGRPLPRFAFGNAARFCKDCLTQAAAAEIPGPGPSTTQVRVRVRPRFSDFPVTSLLLGINVFVFLAMVVSGASPTEPSISQLLRWGADFGPLTLGGQPWRLLTSAFVHVGIIHIAFNMWCFWDLGRMSERVFGGWPYLLIYLFTGVSSSLLSLLIRPVEVSAGASGAIFGICGALIPALYFGRLPVPKPALRATLRSLVIFVVFNLFIGASIAHIDNFAHLGGLLFGLFAGLLLSRTLTAQAETRVRVQGIIFVLLAAMLFGGWRYVERRNSFAAPLARGMEATQHNDLKTATQAFAQAAALRPDIADLHYLLAHTYVAQQQFDKAVPELQRALALEPRQSLAQFDLCYSQLQLKQYEDAVNACAAAAKLNPANISAAINESAALLNLGRYADAIQLLEAWQAKAPNVAEIHMNLGKAYLESGKYDEAVAQYQQAVNLAPKNPAALESLSRAKQKARQ